MSTSAATASRPHRRRWAPAPVAFGAAAACAVTLLLPGTAVADDGATGDRARRALPVYYVGSYLVGETEPGEPLDRLYREFHPTRTVDRPAVWVKKAVLDMLDTYADDPEYTGIWPVQSDVLDVEVRAARGLVVVDMSGIEGPGEPALEDEAAMALQQLVHTATAAASLDGAPITKVVVKSQGERITHLWGADADQPLSRDPYVRSPIWIHAPTQGDRVDGDVVVTGTAQFYENHGQWSLYDRDRVEIDSGVTSTDGSAGLYRPYTIALDTLPVGRYTIKVYDLGGLGLPDRGPVDTKEFRVV